MKVEINDAPNSQKEISIEISYETYEKAMDTETDKVAKDAKLPGFRPGKAPKDVVKKHNLHKIRSAALETLMNETIRDTLIGNNITPLNQPQVTEVVAEEDKPISFKVYVDVFPNFNIEKYQGYSFERTVIEIGEKDVEAAIDSLLKQHTELKPLSKKRKVKEGDTVNIDFIGKVDGVAFDGGTAEKFDLAIGSGQFIPGFEDGVIGMSVGEVKDITVTFPESYHAENLAGKESVFTVTLHDIKEMVAPELNDEFAKKVAPNFDTVDKMRTAIVRDLQAEADQFTKLETFTKILDKIMEENVFDVPLSIAREQATKMAEQNLQQYYQMGINPQMFGMTPQSMAEQFMPDAIKQIKRALIINKIAEIKEFEVTSDDFKKEIERISEHTGRSLEELQQEILSNEQHTMGMQNDLLSTKVYEFLVGENKIKDNKMTREEFEKAQRDKAEAAAKSGGNEPEEKPKKKTAAKKSSDESTEEKTEKKAPAKKAAAKKDTAEKTEKKPAAKKTVKNNEND